MQGSSGFHSGPDGYAPPRLPERFESPEEAEEYLRQGWGLSPQSLFFIPGMPPSFAGTVILLAGELYRSLHIFDKSGPDLERACRCAQDIDFLVQPEREK